MNHQNFFKFFLKNLFSKPEGSNPHLRSVFQLITLSLSIAGAKLLLYNISTKDFEDFFHTFLHFFCKWLVLKEMENRYFSSINSTTHQCLKQQPERNIRKLFEGYIIKKASDTFLYRRLQEKTAATYSPTNAVPSA